MTLYFRAASVSALASDTVRVSGFVAALSELDSALAADLKDVLTRVVATLRPRSSATER